MPSKMKITWDVSQEELKQKYQNERHPKIKQRILMILHIKLGKSARETAERVVVDKNTVCLWCKRFNEAGFEGLTDEERSGSPRKVNYKDLKKVLESSPQNYGYKHQAWHPSLVVIYLNEQQGVKLGETYVYQLVRRLGFRLKVPRTKSYKSNPKKVLEFKKNETYLRKSKT